MILRSAYVTSDGGEQEPCPFCGSTDTSWREGGLYSYDQIYCNLNEYRQLVTAKDKAEQLKNDLENWRLRQEVERLEAQIVKLASGEDSEE